jgi:hypothetical protein
VGTWGPDDWVPPAKAPTYEPGYTAQAELMVLYDFKRAEYLFPTPGRYEIRVMLDVFVGEDLESYRPVRVESNTVAITVKEADGGAYWRWPWQAMLFMGSTSRLPGSSAKPETASSYAHYARYALSQNEGMPAADRIAILKTLVESDPPQQIEDLALLRLAELLYKEKDYEGCRMYAARVGEPAFAPSPSKKKAAELIEKAGRTVK